MSMSLAFSLDSMGTFKNSLTMLFLTIFIKFAFFHTSAENNNRKQLQLYLILRKQNDENLTRICDIDNRGTNKPPNDVEHNDQRAGISLDDCE